MKYKLEKLTFKFENCDQITIDGKNIGFFELDNIHEDMHMERNGTITYTKRVDTFAIEIHSSENKERYPFGLSQLKDLKHTVFERLLRDDIVSINFTLKDINDDSLHSYTYHVYWCENELDNNINTSQNGYISKLGHLYISISRNYSFEHFFSIETINNEPFINFHWEYRN